MRKLFLPILALSCLSAQAQKSVTTGTSKFVLVEEGTGAWCQYCTDGTMKLLDLIAADPKVIGVSFHNGDQMTISDSQPLEQPYVGGWPTGFVDRVAYQGDIEVYRTDWAGAAATLEANAPAFQITMLNAFNTTTREIEVKVTSKALSAQTGNYYMNVYLVEDSLSGTGTGWNQANFYNNTSGHMFYQKGNPIVGFQHRHVIRKMLGGAWGTSGIIPNNPAANSTASRRYTYTLPAGWDHKKMRVVGLVQRWSASTSDRPIMNAVEAKVFVGALNVNDVPLVENLSVYPNPAVGSISITGTLPSATDATISLLNQVGQIVKTQDVKANSGNSLNQTMDVSSIANGIYFLQVSSNEGKSVQKVVVSH